MGNCTSDDKVMFTELTSDVVFCLNNFNRFHPTRQQEIIKLAANLIEKAGKQAKQTPAIDLLTISELPNQAPTLERQ